MKINDNIKVSEVLNALRDMKASKQILNYSTNTNLDGELVVYITTIRSLECITLDVKINK